MLFSDLCKLGIDEMPEPRKVLSYDTYETVNWSDIAVSTKFSVENEQTALKWIRHCLGYLPEPFVYLPSLGFIQALLDGHDKETVCSKQLSVELIFHCTNIRNDDMWKGEWLLFKNYDDHHKHYYKSCLSRHKDAARARLSSFLGYEPDIAHSLEAEVLLREIFEKENFYINWPHGEHDLKAATIVRYREQWLLYGREAADKSGLVGLDWADAKDDREKRFKKPAVH